MCGRVMKRFLYILIVSTVNALYIDYAVSRTFATSIKIFGHVVISWAEKRSISRNISSSPWELELEISSASCIILAAWLNDQLRRICQHNDQGMSIKTYPAISFIVWPMIFTLESPIIGGGVGWVLERQIWKKTSREPPLSDSMNFKRSLVEV